MEDQDRETRIDEDVEAHANKGQHKARNMGKDEGDDVEGHSHHGSHKAAPHKGREDEGDDVEGHVHLNAVNKGTHKA